jgi:protein SCO1/2
LIAFAAPAADDAAAGRIEPAPKEWEGVGITEHPGAQLPLEAAFVDETNKKVRLGDYFGQEKPVLMALVYFRCPMLCGLVINSVLDAMKGMRWDAGKEFECVIVCFDPLETPQLAASRKQLFMAEYARPVTAGGVHFLTGNRENIKKAADAIGFAYKWDPEKQQYMHQAAIYTCTPAGKMSHYLYGVQFETAIVQQALADARNGESGKSGPQNFLFCFNYDETEHKYTLSALKLMRVAGVMTFLVVASSLALFWCRDAKRRSQT